MELELCHISMVLPSSDLIKLHDRFNLVVLGVMVIIDTIYLYQTTVWEQIWTPTSLGSQHDDLFQIFYVIFLSYLVVDSIWIFVLPQSVVSNPEGIVLHHLVCIPLTLVPWFFRQYSWYMLFALSSEINTFLTILRRQLSFGTLSYSICNALFYLTWIILRLILFTLLCFLYFLEYLAISEVIGSYLNLTVCAPICQTAITLLNWKWTYDLVKKSWKKKE
jgi:hypothetical protein